MKKNVDLKDPTSGRADNFNRNDLINVSPSALASLNATTLVKNPELGIQHDMSIKGIGTSYVYAFTLKYCIISFQQGLRRYK
eukprot:403342777